jgi:hypothetical protein
MANIFFNTDTKHIVSANEVHFFAYEGYIKDNEYLADCLMDELDIEDTHKLFLALFKGEETIEELRKRIANDEADSFVEDCEDDIIDLFRPIVKISDEALTEIEDELCSECEEVLTEIEEADNEG